MEIMIFNNVKRSTERNTSRFKFNHLRELGEYLKDNIGEGQDKISNKAFSVCEYEQQLTLNDKNNIRDASNYLKAHIAVIDFDDGNLDNLEKLEESVKEYRYIKYSSFSYGVNAQMFHKYRYVFELEAPIYSHQFKGYMLMQNWKLFKELNASEGSTFGQLFFFPITNTSTEHICKVTYNEGKQLPVLKGFRELPPTKEEKAVIEQALRYSELHETDEISDELIQNLINHKKRSKFKEHNIVGGLIEELINIGDFNKSQDLLGEHLALLKMGTELGWYLRKSSEDSILLLFKDVQSKYKDEERDRTILWGINTGKKKRAESDLVWKKKQEYNLRHNCRTRLWEALGKPSDIPLHVSHKDYIWSYQEPQHIYTKGEKIVGFINTLCITGTITKEGTTMYKYFDSLSV